MLLFQFLFVFLDFSPFRYCFPLSSGARSAVCFMLFVSSGHLNIFPLLSAICSLDDRLRTIFGWPPRPNSRALASFSFNKFQISSPTTTRNMLPVFSPPPLWRLNFRGKLVFWQPQPMPEAIFWSVGLVMSYGQIGQRVILVWHQV